VDAPALDGGRHAPGRVDEREEVRVGIERADRLQDALAAAVRDEPVVDEGDLHRRAGCTSLRALC
jgi:hypothetical protein